MRLTYILSLYSWALDIPRYWIKSSSDDGLICLVNLLFADVTVTAVDVLGSADIFASLLPLILAYIGPVASQDPRVGLLLSSLFLFCFFFTQLPSSRIVFAPVSSFLHNLQ